MSFKSSAIWAIGCNFFVSVINIIGIKMLSGIYDTESYGQELYLYSNSIIIGSIIGLGLGKVINEVQSTNNKYKDEIYKLVFYSVSIFSLCLLIIVSLNKEFFSNNLNVTPFQLNISVYILVLYTLDNLNRSFLIGRKVIKPISLSLLIVTILGWISIYVMSSLNVGSFYLLGMVLITLSSFLFTSFLIVKSKMTSVEYSFLKIKELILDKLLPALASQLLGSAPQLLISTQLIIFFDAKSVAIYVVSMYLFRAMLFIPSGIQRVMLPYIGGLKKDKKLVFIFNNMCLNFIISIPFLIIVFYLKNDIPAIFSFDTNETGNIFLFTVISGVLASCVAPIGQLIISLNKYYFSLLLNLVWAVFYITLSMFVINLNLHIEYIMASLVISYLVHAVLGLLFINKVKNEIGN